MDEPTNPSGGDQEVSRPPTWDDLKRLCAELNRVGARYVVVGGWAIIKHGYPRFTTDIDLLIDPSLDNEARVFEALRSLPDKAVNELDPGDVEKFIVVRVSDEVLVDLMKSGCGVDYTQAIRDAVFHELEGIRIPFASPQTMWRMKQTVRDKDHSDRMFLRQLLEADGIKVDEFDPETPLGRWLNDKLAGGKP